MIALYLAVFQQYKVEEAVSLLQERHPYAKPSCKVVEEALALIRARKNIAIRA